MNYSGQAELAYKLAELSNKLSSDLPSNTESLEAWLAQLPMLNIDQLLHQVPSYIQELNQFKLSDKMRFKMLEILRPLVAHICREIIKRFRNETGLNLSLEFQEMGWLINVLLREMALGYQRLLFNKAVKPPRFYNRTDYAILTERVMFYLGERITFVYMLHAVVPRMIWHDLNSTFRFARNTKLDVSDVSDDFAFGKANTNHVTTIYKRIVLLTMLAPYSLRSAEIEGVYLGLLPLIDRVKFTSESPANKSSYMINWQSERGPFAAVSETKNPSNLFIDTAEFTSGLTRWVETGQVEEQNVDHGISIKLLQKILNILDGSLIRKDKRTPVDGRQVEVIVGLQNIEVFLGYEDAVKDDVDEPMKEIESDEFTINHHWNEKSTKGDWDSLVYNPVDRVSSDTAKKVVAKTNQEVEQRRYYFEVENDSAGGVCLRCNSEQAKGLVLGELILILGQDLETWTLGIIRWMKVNNKKVDLGVYFLGEQVDFISLSHTVQQSKVARKVLWLQDPQSAASLLVPIAQFIPGDVVSTQRKGVELTLMLHEIIWQNEVFSQFRFELIDIEKKETDSEEETAATEQDYLIPSWEK